MPLIQTCVVQDPLHGAVIVHTDIEQGWVEVAGDGMPSVHLRRSPTAAVTEYVPIGTRDPAHLTMTVAGHAASLQPGSGRFTRSSFRVDATVDGARYRLTPSDDDGSRLVRDGRRLGELMLEPETVELLAVWRPDAEIEGQDAAVGYALATAFGTGAASAWGLLIDFLGGGRLP